LILIVTNRTDYTADWLILELERRSTAFRRFNTEDYPASIGIEWALDRAFLRWNEYELDLASVTAVWYRRPVPPAFDLWPTPEEGKWASAESRAALEGVWRSLDAHWVNHPDRNRMASSKLEQLTRAQRLGFHVPETLVTNKSDDLSAFLRDCGSSGIVCKPLEEGRVGEDVFFTTRFIPDANDAFNDLGPEPYLFQKFIDKAYDIRVTVIGNEVFATRIASQETEKGRADWRAAGDAARHNPEQLPPDLVELSLRLIRSYGLEFAAIDLARSRSGEYLFFEVNPNGQWAWIEQLTNQPLGAALADLLQTPRR
jgi:glutathione synthase/RimK-type ligase-like ATP-grasp enzyme